MNSKNNPKKEKSEQTKSKFYFDNLKSTIIIKKIFSYMIQHKSLEIIKINKKIQKRLNLNFNDYKNYSELKSSIEVELIPCENKYDKFINISEEDKEYYHIYFDNSKEEIKRNYLNDNENVKKIKIKIDYEIKSFKDLFYYIDCISSIYFKKFSRNNIIDMSGMFTHCISLKELNLSNFNTNNVTNMSYMFSSCSSLKDLNLSNFNTSNVTNMSYMFYYCSSLKDLNLSNFNTSNVAYMSWMFSFCSSLKKLNLSNFNTDNVTNMIHMFSCCSSLKELNFSKFNISNVTDMNIFEGCRELKKKSELKDNDDLVLRLLFYALIFIILYKFVSKLLY